ncbi:hypothetical protein QYS49_32470 [Marivirga salinae]|uniref:Uncharacterized protein n=1 Tax=Marivirga salinarum TaxID=3059078 RepID=A0AA51NB22_9BACT|nr:hypothetical protein [Marivirga sp. BDSF4-3]WMN12111.1 hypothetical protein QYS49_32470 [Marivirga sp. BDSF4-3]
MKVSIKSIIDGNKEVIILTYVDEFISSPEEKLSLEKKLSFQL